MEVATIELLTRETRSAGVIETLRTALLSGELQPGERLHEVRLSDRLGVSRTPIRAALQRLAAEGLLDHAPNRGYTVRVFPLNEVVAAYEVRAVLEGLAARLAAEDGLSKTMQETLEEALAAGDRLLGRELLSETDRSSYGALNASFHETIQAAAGSRLLGEMIHLCRQVPVSSPRNVVAFEIGDVRRRHDDHHRIYEAIASGEPWRAEVLMREHVTGVRKSLVRSLSSQGGSLEADGR